MGINEQLKHICAAFLSVAAGSQFIHLIFRPMMNFPELVEKEKARIRMKIADDKAAEKQ